jgi:hypothetical protein
MKNTHLPIMLVFISSFSYAQTTKIVSNVSEFTHSRLESMKKLTPLTVQCFEDDKVISSIENTVLMEFKKSILSLDYKKIESLGLNQISNFKQDHKPFRNLDGISEFAWKSSGSGQLSERLKQFSNIEYVDIKVKDYRIDPANRNEKKDFSKSVILARLNIRGINKSQKRMQDNFNLSIEIEKKSNQWTISNAKLLNGKTLIANRAPTFEDVTEKSGLNQASVSLRTEAIRRGGYALSVTDYNTDGKPDLFVGHRDNSEVFINGKNSKFERTATPLDKESYSKTAIFADYNNSGRQDVIINRFIPTDEKGNKIKNQELPAQVAFYKRTEAGYVEQENKFGSASTYKNPMPSAVGDFNGDGLLDIYIGYPGVQDFSQLGEIEQSDKKYQGLYINDGKGGFTDNTQDLNFEIDKYSSRLFPHSALAIDLNQDQKIDLVVLDDRNNLSPAFVNMGNGEFKESSEKIGIVNYNYAMGISSADINNDGVVDLGITNVNFTEMSRTNLACLRHYARTPYSDNEGLKLFVAEKNKKTDFKFNAVPKENFDDIGEGAGGMTFIDYNNDGLVDIYLVNGLWSGQLGGQDLASFFSTAAGVNAEKRSLYSLSPKNNLRFMDILSGFKGTIGDFEDESTISSATPLRPSLAGFQRNRLLRNNGDGTFTDVAFLEGVDSIADGYIVGKIDSTGDGNMDLVLRNADPGTEENKFPSVQLFKNHSNPKKSVVLQFKGAEKNKDGIGLFVKAYAKKWQQVSHLEGNSGSMQQQRLVHFGLGDHKKLDYIEVYWPSGTKQVIKNIGPGYHTIEEPKTAALSKR